MPKRTRTNWALCYAVVGAFVFTGALAMTAAHPASASNLAPESAVRAAQEDTGRETPHPSGSGNLVAQGRAVFDHVCGRCHPNGEEDVGPRIANKNWDEARMMKQIRNGRGRMRAIPPTKLPEANVPALMAYLRTIHAVQ